MATMAFCNLLCRCGNPCDRQDDHGGDCDCREPHTSRYVFYAIANRPDLDGAKWYRTYSPHNEAGFVDDVADAKIWARKSLAQGKCTRLGNEAYLIEFVVEKVNVVDQRERLRELAEKKRRAEEQRRKTQAEREIDDALRALKAAQDKVARLTGGHKYDDQCGCKSCMGM